MIRYTTTILRFDQQGEKTGWTFIEVPPDIAETLVPGNRKGFRVKGKLDAYPIRQMAVMPIGNGKFIIPLNATVRKAIHKSRGAMLTVQLSVDTVPYMMNKELLECLDDEPTAKEYFYTLTLSHRTYYSKWIDAAKTEPTRIRRIALAVSAMERSMDFGQMLREQKKLNDLRG